MVVRVEVPGAKSGDDIKFGLFSDIHFDNPKCRRDLLKQDLDECLKENRWIIINGDLLCLMQGKFDPRRNKSAIRPEDNVDNYLDSVIDHAVDFFAPYAHLILMVGTGNHESAILKNIETNMLRRFCDLLKLRTGQHIHCGAYHGWVIVRFICGQGRTANRVPFKIYHHHGAGGDAIVTKGSIEHERLNVAVEGADLIWAGHNHNQYHIPTAVHYLDTNPQSDGIPKMRVIHSLRTPTYKQEYTEGGFHIEKGRRPKPLGFAKLDLKLRCSAKNRFIEPTIQNITHNEVGVLNHAFKPVEIERTGKRS